MNRCVALAGAVNLRDVGGYRCVDGRRVRRGVLWRSDSLSELTESDQLTLVALELRSLVDLRDEDERRHKPNRLHPLSFLQTHAVGFYPNGSRALVDGVRDRSLSSGDARQMMLAMYRSLALDHTQPYARMLQWLLSRGTLPALIHCTSGKDRTGFGVAVILLALGVPRATIVDDYVLTNHYRRDLSFLVGTDVDPVVLDTVQAADPDFLAAAFDVIDDEWGGLQRFLREGLQLTAADQAELQRLLLEA